MVGQEGGHEGPFKSHGAGKVPFALEWLYGMPKRPNGVNKSSPRASARWVRGSRGTGGGEGVHSLPGVPSYPAETWSFWGIWQH